MHFVSPSAGFAVADGTGIILYGGAAPEVAGVVLATSDGGAAGTGWRPRPMRRAPA